MDSFNITPELLCSFINSLELVDIDVTPDTLRPHSMTLNYPPAVLAKLTVEDEQEFLVRYTALLCGLLTAEKIASASLLISSHQDELLEHMMRLLHEEGIAKEEEEEEEEQDEEKEEDLLLLDSPADKQRELVAENLMLSSKALDLEKAFLTLKERLDLTEKEKRALQTRVAELSNAHLSQQRDDEYFTLMSENSKLEQRVKDLEAQLAEARYRPKETASPQHDLERKLDEAKRRLKAALEENQIAKSDAATLQQRCTTAETTKRQLQVRLEKLQLSLNKQKEKEQEILQSKEKLHEELARLRADVEQAKLEKAAADTRSSWWTPRLSLSAYTTVQTECVADELMLHQKRSLDAVLQEKEELEQQLIEAGRELDRLRSQLLAQEEKAFMISSQQARELLKEHDVPALQAALTEAKQLAESTERLHLHQLAELQLSVRISEENGRKLETEIRRLKTELEHTVPLTKYTKLEAESLALQRSLQTTQESAASLEKQVEVFQCVLEEERQIKHQLEEELLNRPTTLVPVATPAESSSEQQKHTEEKLTQRLQALQTAMERSRDAEQKANKSAAEAADALRLMSAKLLRLQAEHEKLQLSHRRLAALHDNAQTEKSRLQQRLGLLQQQLETLTLRKANANDQQIKRGESLAVLKSDIERAAATLKQAEAAADEREQALLAVLKALTEAAAREFRQDQLPAGAHNSMQTVIALSNKQKKELQAATAVLAQQLKESEGECTRLRAALRKNGHELAAIAKGALAKVSSEETKDSNAASASTFSRSRLPGRRSLEVSRSSVESRENRPPVDVAKNNTNTFLSECAPPLVVPTAATTSTMTTTSTSSPTCAKKPHSLTTRVERQVERQLPVESETASYRPPRPKACNANFI